MAWFSRYVLAWELSILLDKEFCLTALDRALGISRPEIFNSDQGGQYTSADFTGRLEAKGIRISMDGRGRVFDNVFIERLWRTVKYEEVYLHAYDTMDEARRAWRATSFSTTRSGCIPRSVIKRPGRSISEERLMCFRHPRSSSEFEMNRKEIVVWRSSWSDIFWGGSHLELKRIFGIGRLLNPSTAGGIWEECREKLSKDEFAAQGNLRRMKVEAICTMDDPIDDLRYHEVLKKAKDFPVSVYPAFRPDTAMAIEERGAFSLYVEALSRAAGMDVRSYDVFLEALRKRHDHFHSMGCRISDHGLETIFAKDYTDAEVGRAFAAALAGKTLAPYVILQFKSALLYEFAVMDWEKAWVQQFHLGALRNINTRLTRSIGPDSGFDLIGDFGLARPLAKFLDRLDSERKLAKTILYNLNPRDNEVLATISGSFPDGTVPGKMQFGPAWWFLDQMDGMTSQIRCLSNMGLLSRFIGMTTDSRSFLSFPRHEYFRRLLCRILGGDMKQGLMTLTLSAGSSGTSVTRTPNAISSFRVEGDEAQPGDMPSFSRLRKKNEMESLKTRGR